ncbi:hypothetical protein Lepto7376_4600 [[Leptolyngbya] sp. PCC 7376]|nr:hypothetical protein Lepto7376_4600 [[Leptolyngbya] sp. PCC 7376]
MEAQLFYKTEFSFYQTLDPGNTLLLSNFRHAKNSIAIEPCVITCKTPRGLTRQERYQRIKALMQR